MENLTYLQEEALKQVLGRKKDNPITGLEITRQINIRERDSGKEGADIRSIVNALRCKGYPICATGEGYYYARTEQELAEFIDSFQGRIDKQQQACDGLKRSYDKLTLQYNVPGEIPQRRPASVPAQRRWQMPSSKFGKVYEVIDIGTAYICNCEGFNYHRKCKHIDMVKKEVKKEREKEFKDKQKSLL